MPFQPGNTEASKARKNKPWRDAINRAIKRREEDDPQALERLATRLLHKVDEGDVSAIKEFGDRLDGKVAQPIAGDEDAPLKTVLEVTWKAAALSDEGSS